jgi:hypothetical protein
MCMVSNIGDIYGKKYPQAPWYPSIPDNPVPITYTAIGVSKEEFDALKKEVKELKKLLLAAKKFDEATGQPDCEMEDKVAVLKKVAKAFGVNIDEVFK